MWNFYCGTKKSVIGSQQAALSIKLIEQRIQDCEKNIENAIRARNLTWAANQEAIALGLTMARRVVIDEFAQKRKVRKRK